MLRLHLSCMSTAAQIECAGAKARFCLRKYDFYYIQNFTFYILHFTFLRVSARLAAGRFSALPFFEIRLPFALRYAILKMAHNFTFFSNHGIRNRHFVSLISHGLEIVCQRSEILMQGVSSVEGTLFYFSACFAL